MATQKLGSDIPLGEVKLALERSLDGADAARGAALAGLAGLRAAKSTALAREQARLAGKYGSQDERTLAVAERAAVNQVLVRQVAAEAVRATIEAPAPDPRAWILHGRVLDAALAGVPSLTVALYDAKDVWLSQLGHACTDKTGYFRLTATAKSERIARPEDEKLATRQPSAFLRVLDARGATLHKDPIPLAPALGRVDFRQIVLGEPPARCAPPDGNTGPKPGGMPPNTPTDEEPRDEKPTDEKPTTRNTPRRDVRTKRATRAKSK